jgi:DNA-binding transcriptional LysR family regulator
MDIRTMQYYLAVVREGTISAAAEALHVAQPSLSRQMKELEKELGAALFVRGNRRITLTAEGVVLRKRAEEMVQLLQMTEEEISRVKNHVSGPVRIGAGESRAFHYLSRTAANMAAQNPDIRFHITSGDTRDLMNELADSLIDFALIFTEVDHSLYESIPLPAEDSFAVLMKKESPLAEKKELRISDLQGCPLIVSRASQPLFAGTNLNIVATYNLIYNASLMVEDGLGYAICFDRLINTTGDSRLCVRPLVPRMETAGNLIWKKYQVFSPAVRLFIEEIRRLTEA